MTPAQFAAIFPRADAAVWAQAITDAWAQFGFTSVNARAGFLGICGNETGGFTRVTTENTAWTSGQMMALFGVNAAKAADLAGKSAEARANYCYQHRIGNGDEASGDGFRFRGRGIVQLTGRGNYKAAGDAIGLDLVSKPDLAASDPRVSAAIAAWFMSSYARIMPELEADSEASFLEGARKVGATDATATQRRLAYRRAALAVLNAVPSNPRVSAAGPPPPASGIAPSPAARAAPWWWDWLLKLLGRA